MKNPDWGEWSLMPKVELWSAVALSMNLEPHDLRRDVQTPLLGFGSFFKPGSFSNLDAEREFEKRLRILDANLKDSEKFPNAVINYREIRLSVVALNEFSAWAVSVGWEIPEELNPKSAEADEGDRVRSKCKDAEGEIAALFDPVSPEALEKYFPAEGHWRKWANKAKATGLDIARCGRQRFNPYIAAKWWIKKHPQDGWDLSKAERVLAKKLPVRSRGSEHMLGIAESE